MIEYKWIIRIVLGCAHKNKPRHQVLASFFVPHFAPGNAKVTAEGAWLPQLLYASVKEKFLHSISLQIKKASDKRRKPQKGHFAGIVMDTNVDKKNCMVKN